jgi:SAM-dependent methyltransferase
VRQALSRLTPKRMARMAQALLLRPALWSKKHCIICGKRHRGFLPHRGGSSASPALMIALDVVGSDVDNFECPWCGSNDRDRHLVLFMNAMGLGEALRGARVVHFAPERAIARYVLGQSPDNYLPADLAPARGVAVQMNIETMPLADESVDFLIANHVLEHVENLSSTLGDIHRVLRPGGLAVLQTPFSSMLQQTFCDPGIMSQAARLEAYGQEDHVRLFGQDIHEIICRAGFKSLLQKHEDLLREIDPVLCGVNRLEPFFLYERTDAQR